MDAEVTTNKVSKSHKCPDCGLTSIGFLPLQCRSCGLDYRRTYNSPREIMIRTREQMKAEGSWCPGRNVQKVAYEPMPYTEDEKRKFYVERLVEAEARGYARGWAWHKYREMFGEHLPESFRAQ